MSNGAILWRGPSLLDGAPLVVIAIGLEDGSSNSKTGSMLQTYILRADMDPRDAVHSGADVSICGQCPHRGRLRAESLEPGQVLTSGPDPSAEARTVFNSLAERGHMVGRTCYVVIGQGPTIVWKSLQRGLYPDVRTMAAETGIAYGLALRDLGRDRLVRLGTYGDPAAVPVDVWQALVSRAAGHTGYTHQYRTCDQALRHLCMASADSVADAAEAQAKGWRTFRVSMPCDPIRTEGEAVCPASAEAGRKLTCSQCLACNGANGRRGSIVIQAHGGTAIQAAIRKQYGIRPYFARST